MNLLRRQIKTVFFLILASFAISACQRSSAPTTSSSTLDNLNVLLIIVDTLGTRHTGIYNDSLDTTPNLNALAERSVVFNRAYSASSWTKPSLSSAFTSLFPSQHHADKVYVPLDRSFETLAERMQARGYKTVGFVSHTMLSHENGFDQGFDEYAIAPINRHAHFTISSENVTRMALDWFNKNGNFLEPQQDQAGSRFFMSLHYFDPHFSYMHHPQFDYSSWYKGKLKAGAGFRTLKEAQPNFTPDDVKFLIDLYREEIKFTDFHIGRLLDELKARGIDKNTMIVFMADHGEEFLEHKAMGHSHTLYEELVHVPFMFSMPGLIQPRRIDTPVSTMDLLPTLEEFFAVPNPRSYWQGRSLKSSLSGSAEPPDRHIFSELEYDAPRVPSAHKLSIVAGEQKLITDEITKQHELYNLQKDPLELNNLAASSKELVERLSAELAAFKEMVNKTVDPSIVPAKPAEQSPEQIKQLKSLGYL